ncbi:hypothetical protein [Halovivax gelatinilyticus]|uniref:hypothetical protein n=1 Tax=Halovivax gelatinilyticus TaxID=2961597 RepID=UPI0020CA394B|nr:hypothetical protein [Halovivax gelatinilyticus]
MQSQLDVPPQMYTIDDLKQGVKSPNLIAREVNRHYYTRRFGPGYNRKGTDIFEEDWDTLIILDACRYDIFKDENTLPGELTQRESRGSNTVEFLRGNFNGEKLYDTVYTTANPQLVNNRDQIKVEFCDEINVWNTNRWDDKIGSVLPEDMTDAAIESVRKYPNKRHIFHYLQPHYPFISSNIDNGTRGVGENKENMSDIWGERFRGRINLTREKIWDAYVQNLRECLNHLQRLINILSGKTVVSSDHGNMVGERSGPIPIREWGHPSRTYTEHLVKVPWLIYEEKPRREIISEKGQKTYEVDMSTVDSRLEDLGYR